MEQKIVMEVNGPVATISIRRPEALNALNRDMVDEMDRLVDEAMQVPGIRVLVFYSPDNFAAGADIKDMAVCDEEGAKAFLFTPTYNKIQALPIPTIAVIEGYAFGGGLELALRCDFRIAAKNAKMGLTELNLGIMPGAGGTVMLARLIGKPKAKEMIYMSRIYSGEEAEQIGLVNRAVEPEELQAEADKWVKKLCTRSRPSLAATKASMEYAVGHPEYDGASNHEGEIWASLFQTHDQKEGMRAFIEKRKPVYTD